jgi:hypothetical protein
LAEFRETPSQWPARVVRNIPEQLAEAFPPLRLSEHSEIGEERAGFSWLR